MLSSVFIYGMCSQWYFKRKKSKKGQFIPSMLEMLCQIWEMFRALDPCPCPRGRWVLSGRGALLGSNQKLEFVEVVLFHSVLRVANDQWLAFIFLFWEQLLQPWAIAHVPSSFTNSSGECTTPCLDYWGKHLCNSDASTGVKLLIHWDPPFSLIRPVSEGFAETIPETLTLILTNVHLAYFLIFPLNI